MKDKMGTTPVKVPTPSGMTMKKLKVKAKFEAKGMKAK